MRKITLLLLVMSITTTCKKKPAINNEIKLPQISSMNPGTGKAGDAVTIKGKNFTTEAIVVFGSTNAQINVSTPTQLTVKVPAGSDVVQVYVQIGEVKSNEVSFTYYAVGDSPELTSLKTNTSIIGDTITVLGKNFDASSKLYFGLTEVPTLSSTATSMTAVLPVGNGSVKVSVKSTDDNGTVLTSNQLDFTFASVSEKTVTIDGISYKIDTLSYFKIGPSSYYLALKFFNFSSSKPIRAFLTIVDVTDQYMSFKPVVGRDSVSNNEKPSAMAIRKSSPGNRYIAGTNSDFFNLNTGYPRNANMIDGVLASPPDNHAITGNSYPGIAIFDAQKKMDIDAMTYKATATIGTQTMNIDTINYYSMKNPNSLMFYNIYTGITTGTDNSRTEVAITPVSGNWNYNGETTVKVVEKYINSGNHVVTNSICYLSGTGTGQTFLNQLNVNDVAKVKFTMTSRGGGSIVPYNMTGGRQILMKNGNIFSDFWNGDEKHPRTGIGFSNNGTKIYMCVIDGRSTIAADVFTSEMAQVMKYYGATAALNLDGGGSSTMYLDKIGTVNNPSDGNERSVVAGIFAVSSAPDDNQIVEMVPKQYTVRLSQSQSFTPVFYGLNKYGQIVNNNLTGVTITPNGLGSLSGGSFIAGHNAGYGYIVAKYNKLATRIRVVIQ